MDPCGPGQRATLAGRHTDYPCKPIVFKSLFNIYLGWRGEGGAGGSGFAVNPNGEPLLDSEFILHKNVLQSRRDRNSLSKSLSQLQ